MEEAALVKEPVSFSPRAKKTLRAKGREPGQGRRKLFQQELGKPRWELKWWLKKSHSCSDCPCELRKLSITTNEIHVSAGPVRAPEGYPDPPLYLTKPIPCCLNHLGIMARIDALYLEDFQTSRGSVGMFSIWAREGIPNQP